MITYQQTAIPPLPASSERDESESTKEPVYDRIEISNPLYGEHRGSEAMKKEMKTKQEEVDNK